MKNIKIITLLAIVLALTNCKKEETPTESATRASTDIATDISGTWIASTGLWSDAFGTNPTTTVPKIVITRISSDKVSISSPTSIFPSFTVDRLIVESTGLFKYKSLQYAEFLVGTDMQISIAQLKPNSSDIYKHLSFVGYKQ